MLKSIATYKGKKREYGIIVLEHTSDGVIYQIDGTDIGGNYKSVVDAMAAIIEYDDNWEPLDLQKPIEI